MNWAVTFNRGRRDIGIGVAKFFLASVVCSFAWIWAISVMNGGTGQGSTTEITRITLAMASPAVLAAVVYFQLPERTVDWYHKAGKLFAMFVAVNVMISLMFLAWQFMEAGKEVTMINVITLWAFASIGIPGPYVGSILGARWVKWSERGGFL